MKITSKNIIRKYLLNLTSLEGIDVYVNNIGYWIESNRELPNSILNKLSSRFNATLIGVDKRYEFGEPIYIYYFEL